MTALPRRHSFVPILASLILAIASLALSGSARAETQPETMMGHGLSWDEDIKPWLFEDREILDGSAIVKLDVPTRPQDASLVPVTIEALLPQEPDRYIKTLTLAVDHNPFVVAAVFHLSPENAIANVSTRIRLHQYSDVRAVAEMNDGTLYMVSHFVKAVGGCSAPALKNQEQTMAELGRLLLRQDPGQEASPRFSEAKLNIRHPSYSGMQLHFDGSYYIPEHYVTRVEVRQGERLLVAIDGSVGLSEDPVFEFAFRPTEDGDLSVEVIDSKENRFAGTWPVEAKGT
jgi:sulfur-oxidizing protein SoxY